jgi:SMI1 / KNR4 family (SUKH-1)
MGVNLNERREPATQQAVEEAERLLEVKIPDEYRLFLLQESNGGRPEDCIFTRDEWPQPGVDEFLGVGLGGDSDLVTIYERYSGRMPSWCLPIADPAGGDWLCLSLREGDRGTVFFWFHEEEADEGEPATERNLYRIADGFDDFLYGLVPMHEAEVEIDESQVGRSWIDPEFREEMRRRGLMD